MSDFIPKSVLGEGQGLDHIAVATNNLEAAANQYQYNLGFASPQSTKLPNGIENSIIWFADGTYLELFTFYDREKAGFIAQMVGNKEGGMFYALDISSAEGTIAFLRQQGFEVTDPVAGTTAIEGMTEPPPELWRYVMFLKPITPANEVFFIEYKREVLAELSQKYPGFSPAATAVHANTATSLKSVWMAVEDVETAAQAYGSMGLETGEAAVVPYIAAAGLTIEAAQSTILLLAPDKADGATASFLAQRGAGPIGISIEVTDLPTAVRFLEAHIDENFEPYAGLYGQSILIPAEYANSIWIELFQQE